MRDQGELDVASTVLTLKGIPGGKYEYEYLEIPFNVFIDLILLLSARHRRRDNSRLQHCSKYKYILSSVVN
jgi:hypothetical protein